MRGDESMIEKRELPDEWKAQKLGHLITMRKGRVQEPIFKEQVAGSKPHILVESFDGIYKKFTTSTNGELCTKDDILIIGDGSRYGLIETNLEGYVGSTLGIISTKGEIIKDYLYYYLTFKNDIIRERSKGSGIPHIDKKFLLDLDVFYPQNKSEQQKIVDKLDKQMLQIEMMKKEVKKSLESVEKYHLSLNNNLFKTNGTDNKIVSLNDICTIRSGQVDPRKEEFRKLPHIYGVCIESGTGRLLEYNTVEKDEIISGKYLFKSGDVLYSKLRPYLKKVVYVDFNGLCSADMYALDVDRAKVNPRWLVLFLLSDEFTRYAIEQSTRARMPKLNKDQLNAWKFDLPPLENQNLKLKEFQIRIEQQNQIKINIKTQLNAINQLPASILNEVFGQYQINS